MNKKGISLTFIFMLVEINDKIISTEVFSEQFVCDLSKCKGACCVEGDGGAPLKESERILIKKNLEKIKPFMNKKGIDTIEKTDFYYEDEDDLPATQLVDKKECVFVYFNKENNHAMCAIENAYNAGEISFNKPISCHLYPIRTKEFNEFTALNYERWNICNPACDLGASLKLPVYKFLKDPLTRAYGKTFYKELEKVDAQLKRQEKTT